MNQSLNGQKIPILDLKVFMSPTTSPSPLEYVLKKVKVTKLEQGSAPGDSKLAKYFVSMRKKKVEWRS